MVMLRTAVIGCGRMGVFTTDRTRALVPDIYFPLSHAEAIAAHPGLELVGVCDVNGAVAAAAADAYPTARAFSDVEKMLESTKPDIVTIATRTAARPDLVRRLLAAGVKGLHVEKPLCNNIREASELTQAIAVSGAAFTYGTLRRFMAPYRLAKTLAAELGDVKHVTISHGSHEMLLWTHPHFVDLMLYFADDVPQSVNAICDFGDTKISKEVIDCDPRVAFARVLFKNGVQGLISSGSEASVTVSCAAGSVRVSSNGTLVEVLNKQNGAAFAPVPVQAGHSGTLQAISELHDSILNGTPTSIRPEDVLNGQKVLWAIALSATKDGCTTEISEAARSDLTITGRIGDVFA